MTIKKEKIGNITWNIFHYLTYQTENVESLKQLWLSVISIYPCLECRAHIFKLMKDRYSKELQSVTTIHEFAMFLYKIHQSANLKLRKNFSINLTDTEKNIFSNKKIVFQSEADKLVHFQTTMESLMKEKLTNPSMNHYKLGNYTWILLHSLLINIHPSSLSHFVTFWKHLLLVYPFTNTTVQDYLELQTSSLEELVNQRSSVNSISLWLYTVHNKVSEILSRKKYELEKTTQNQRFFQRVIQEELNQLQKNLSRNLTKNFTMKSKTLNQENIQKKAYEKTLTYQIRGCYLFDKGGGCGCSKGKAIRFG